MNMKKAKLASKAYARYIRVSPRKTREVIDLIRGEKVNSALAILKEINKRAAIYVDKAVRSAISNARSNPQVLADELFISKVTADNGPMLKRYRAAAMGRATMIRHRTTHLTVELSAPEAKKAPVKVRKRMVRHAHHPSNHPEQSRRKIKKQKAKK